MKKLFNFIFWPALAGLAFAVTLVLAPRLVSMMPGLAAYFAPVPAVVQVAAPPAPLSYSEVVKHAFPAVVSINFSSLEERIPGEEYPESNSLGSGVIVSPDGFIITSYHVFFDEYSANSTKFSPEISVTLSDSRNIEATIVSLDQSNDLALLKVFEEDLPYLRLADTSRLEVGNVVLAIGNPRNIGQSVTFGIISALSRRDDSFMIQTDAAINPGNSGGALIDVAGKLIGINSTIVSESGGSEGISFSIPADKAIALLERYLASGPSGYLGVSTAALTLEDSRELFGRDMQGFIVKEVSSNSPAEKAGLRVNDVITGVNETTLSVDKSNALEAFRSIFTTISSLPPGEQIVLEIFRDNEFRKVPAILGIGEPQIYGVAEETNPTAAPALVLPPRPAN